MAEEGTGRRAPAHMRRERMQRRARFVLGVMAAVAIGWRMWSSYAG